MNTTLYRYFDSEGQLLYVGVTKNPFDRQDHHYRNQPWWNEVHHATFEHFDSRDLALTYETEAIGTEFPKYNKAGPTLDEESRRHLLELMSNEYQDEFHNAISTSMANLMLEVNEFSQKKEAHKLLFAFGESIPWDADGDEMLIECLKCQRIADSKWFKNQFYDVHGEICEEYR